MSSSSSCQLIAGTVVILVSGCFSAPQNDYQQPPPPNVTVAHPVLQTVVPMVEENGETEAKELAVVRARVQGYLEEIKFTPGKPVEQGAELFLIEKDQYQANLDSAEARLDSAIAAIAVSEAQVGVAKAAFDGAEAEFQRQEKLLKQEATTQTAYDAALTTRNAAAADLKAAEASVTAAKADRKRAEAERKRADLDLEYTTVKAPISGVITKTNMKVGNLVENGTELATIVNLDEVYANFNLSDREVLRFEKNRDPSKGEFEWRGREVYLRRELDDGFPFIGEGDYVDVEGIDQSTGTLALRAVFKNEDESLRPGLFVRIRVYGNEKTDAILIPDESISRDQLGEFVLKVNPQNVVEQQRIQTGLKFDGWSVVENGLSVDDKIIVAGIQKARDGDPVATDEKTLEPPKQPIGKKNSDTADSKEPAVEEKASIENPEKAAN